MAEAPHLPTAAPRLPPPGGGTTNPPNGGTTNPPNGGGTPPAPLPISVTATAISPSQVSLSWSGAATKLYRSTQANFTPGTDTLIAENQANVTTHTDTGLTPNTTYYYVLVPNGNPDLTEGSASATTLAPAPGPKAWSPGPKIGVITDEQGNPVNDEDGNPTMNGHLLAPQDQTQTPADPAQVFVTPGQELPCEVDEVTDTDLWTRSDDDPNSEDSGSEDDEIVYEWMCSGGEFTQGTDGASTMWMAPTTPGTYTLSVTMNDAPTAVEAPDTGSRDDDNDEALSRSVTVTVVAPALSFTQSVVAVGAQTNDAHKAAFEITVTDQAGNPIPDVEVETPVVVEGTGLGPNDETAAEVEMESNTTDENGKARGHITSGNRLGNTTIRIPTDPDAPQNGPTASVEQVWNQLSDEEAWSYDPYFEYDESSPINYRMAYTRDGEEVNITEHNMEPELTAISGYEWHYIAGEDWDEDGLPNGDYFYETYSIDDADSSGYDAWSGLVEWGGVSESDGTYTVPQTIKYDEDFEVDTVYFWLWDNDSYGEDGAE